MSRRRTERPGRREREEAKQLKRRPAPPKASSLRDYFTPIYPKTKGQEEYLDAVNSNTLTICTGPAGSGKSLIAFNAAVQARLNDRQIRRIVLVRPTILGGDDSDIGFLPGSMYDKMLPYLAPLLIDSMRVISSDLSYGSLNDTTQIEEMIASLNIEIIPLAYLKGRSLSNAFIILDEAQNSTYKDLTLFLTRIGENSKVIIEGDLSQADISDSGLVKMMDKLRDEEDIAIVELLQQDIVRSRLVAKILRKLEL